MMNIWADAAASLAVGYVEHELVVSQEKREVREASKASQAGGADGQTSGPRGKPPRCTLGMSPNVSQSVADSSHYSAARRSGESEATR